jgi:hypothetical protein
MPHVHISGINGVITFLFVVAAFGSVSLVASAYPDAAPSKAWRALGF